MSVRKVALPLLPSEKNLVEVVDLIRQRPMSARQVADAVGCSLVSAYDRIRKIVALGVKVHVEEVRIGMRGPKSDTYAMSAQAATRAKKKLTPFRTLL